MQWMVFWWIVFGWEQFIFIQKWIGLLLVLMWGVIWVLIFIYLVQWWWYGRWLFLVIRRLLFFIGLINFVLLIGFGFFIGLMLFLIFFGNRIYFFNIFGMLIYFIGKVVIWNWRLFFVNLVGIFCLWYLLQKD